MNRLLPWLLVAPAIVLILVLLILPLLDTVSVSFSQEGGWFAGYVDFFESRFNRGVLWRTIRIAFIVTAISILVGFPTAYFIARAPQRWRSILIVASVFPLLTGTVVRSFAWIVILGRNGFINEALLGLGVITEPMSMLYSEGAIIVGLAYLFSPLMILSLVGVLENIDKSVVEASISLGASPTKTFWRVILPLAMPGVIVGAVLVFTGSFTAYTTPVLLGGQRNTVLATLLFRDAMVEFDWVSASTIAVIMMVVTIAVVLGMSRVARRLNPAAA
jgi:putative spermidine/putrescine transport system permease protein